MKRKIVVGFMLAGTMLTAFAFKVYKLQSNGRSGIYLTVQDFYNHKLTYGFDCNSNSGKLKLNDMFGSSGGYIINNGEKHGFDKYKTYGYQNCDNETYRFFGKDAYKILDTTEFYLYYRYQQIEKIKGKGLIKTDEYFFSKDGGSAIQSLTAENLKKAFPDNYPFHYAIDSHFRTDQDLISYDSFGSFYKLKYIYTQSLK